MARGALVNAVRHMKVAMRTEVRAGNNKDVFKCSGQASMKVAAVGSIFKA